MKKWNSCRNPSIGAAASGGRLYLSNLNCVFCFYLKSILFTATSKLKLPLRFWIRPHLKNSLFKLCRSWTLPDCGLHGAAYPSRSAASVLLPTDNFPHCLSNVSAAARPGLALSLHDLSAAFDCRYPPLKLLTNCFSSAPLSFSFLPATEKKLDV